MPSLAFDPHEYLANYADVAAAHIDPLLHFLAVRLPARAACRSRRPSCSTANGFDYVYYLQQQSGRRGGAASIRSRHFQTIGWQEGRNPNALFDTAGYLATYADVAAAHVNPLDHYSQFGWHEGRDPSVGFDTDVVSRGLRRCGGRARQSARALPPVRHARRPLGLRGRRLGIGTGRIGAPSTERRVAALSARTRRNRSRKRRTPICSRRGVLKRSTFRGEMRCQALKCWARRCSGCAVMFTPAQAQRPVWEQTGTLNCDVSAGFGFIVGSQRAGELPVHAELSGAARAICRDHHQGRPRYRRDRGGSLVWAVHMSTTRRRGVLAGSYAGASAEATARSGPRRERAGRRQRPLGRVAAALGAGPDRHQRRGRHRRDRAAVRPLTLSLYLLQSHLIRRARPRRAAPCC